MGGAGSPASSGEPAAPPGGDRSEKQSTDSLLHDRTFLIFGGGTLVSSIGNTLLDVALPLLVYATSRSLSLIGAVVIAGRIPRVIGAPFLGSVVDRFGGRRTIFFSYWSQTILVAAFIGLAMLADPWRDAAILADSFVLGAADLLGRLASFALLPTLFRERRASANLYLTSVWTSSLITGPALGAFLLTLLPVKSLLILDAASFVPIVLCMRAIVPKSYAVIPPTGSIWSDAMTGVRIIFGNAELRRFSLGLTLGFFAAAPIMTILVYTLKHHGSSNAVVSLAFAASGAGIFGGTLVTRYFVRQDKVGFAILGGWGIFLAGFLLLIASSIRSLVPAAVFLVSLGGMGFVSARTTLVQQGCPENLLGRIEATFQLMQQAGGTVGVAIGVTLAGLGFTPACVVLALCALLGLAFVTASGIPMRDTTASPLFAGIPASSDGGV